MRVQSFSSKIKNAIRLDRAIAIVWKASRKWTICSALLTLVNGMLPLALLYLLKLIIDTITTAVQTGVAEDSFTRITYLVIAATAVSLVQSACKQASAFVSATQTALVTDYVTNLVHKKSLSLDLSYYENPTYYDTLHRAQLEGPYRAPRIVSGLTNGLQSLVSLIAMMGLLFMFHWSTSLLLFFSVLPGLVAQMLHAHKQFTWQKKRTPDERKARYISNLLTLDSYAKEIRLFDLGKHFSKLYNGIRELLRGEKLTLAKSKAIADFFSQLFAAIILMGSLLFIAYRTLYGAITIGDMVMYFQAFQRGVANLKDLLAQVAALYEDNLFVANFFEFLDIKCQVVDPKNPQPVPQKFQLGITLKDVSFQYPGERDKVLNNLSFSIKPGEVVAIVGANGAGKSTLVKLLCRLYDPQSGSITIDGVKLSDYSQKDLRKQISVVFQDFAKYFLKVKENIWLGDTSLNTDSRKVREAAQKADADSFINNLPNKYDTQLGKWFQSGEELSLGEWQKIVLARAFLRDAQLIILDEPTSSMDVHTEYHLFTKFRELIAARSALIISHRFSTVKMVDKIFVFDGGKITESGTHQQLMAREGMYAEMYLKQAAWLTDI